MLSPLVPVAPPIRGRATVCTSQAKGRSVQGASRRGCNMSAVFSEVPIKQFAKDKEDIKDKDKEHIKDKHDKNEKHEKEKSEKK